MARIVPKCGREIIRRVRDESGPFVRDFADPEEPTFEFFKCQIDVYAAAIMQQIDRWAKMCDKSGNPSESFDLTAGLYGDPSSKDRVLLGAISGLTAFAEMPSDGGREPVDPKAVQPQVEVAVKTIRALLTSFYRFLKRHSSDPNLHLALLADVRTSFDQIVHLLREPRRWGDKIFCAEIERSCDAFCAQYVLLVEAIARTQRWFHPFDPDAKDDAGHFVASGRTVYTARQLEFLQNMAAARQRMNARRMTVSDPATGIKRMISPAPVAKTALALGTVLGQLLSDTKANATRLNTAVTAKTLLELAHGAHRGREMISNLVANLFSYTESGAAAFDLKTAQDAEKAMSLIFGGVLKFNLDFDVKRLHFAFIAFWRSFLAYHESKGKIGTIQLLRWNYYLFNIDFERFVAFLYASARKADDSICDEVLQGYVGLSAGFKAVHHQLAISTDALVMINEGLRANCAVFPLGAQLLYYDKGIECNSVNVDNFVSNYMESCRKKFSRFNLIDPNATMIQHAIVPFAVRWWSESFRPFIDRGELTVADNRKLEKIRANYLAEWHRLFEILQQLLPTRSLCVEADELIDQMRDILDTQAMSRKERGVVQDEVVYYNKRLQGVLRLILVALGCLEVGNRGTDDAASVPSPMPPASANKPQPVTQGTGGRKMEMRSDTPGQSEEVQDIKSEASVATQNRRPEEVFSMLKDPLDEASTERSMVLVYEDNQVVDAPSFYSVVADKVAKLKDEPPSRIRFDNACLCVMEGAGIAARSFDRNLPNYQWMRDAFRLLLDVPKTVPNVEVRNAPLGGLGFKGQEAAAIVAVFTQMMQCLNGWLKTAYRDKGEFTPDDRPDFAKTVYTLCNKSWPPLHPKPVEYQDLLFNAVEVRGEKLWLFNKDVLESIFDDLAYHLPNHTDLKQIVLAKARELGRAVKDAEVSATGEWQFYTDTLVELVKLRDARRNHLWFIRVCSTMAEGVAIAAEHRDRQLYRYRWLKLGFSLLKERPRTSEGAERKSAVHLHFSEMEAEKMEQAVEDLLVQLGAWMEECGHPDPNIADDELRKFILVVYDLSTMRWPRLAKKLFDFDSPSREIKSAGDMMFTMSRVSGRLRYVNSIFVMLEDCCVADALPKNATPDEAKNLVKKDYDRCLSQEFSLEIRELPTELGKPPAIKITWGQTTKLKDADEGDKPVQPAKDAEAVATSSQSVQPVTSVALPAPRVIPATIKPDKRLNAQLAHCALILRALEFYRVETGRQYRETQNDNLLRPPEMPQIVDWVNVAISKQSNGEEPEKISEKTLRGVLSKALGAAVNHVKDVLRCNADEIKGRSQKGRDKTAQRISKMQAYTSEHTKRHPLYFDPRICAYWIGFSSADFVLAEKPMYKMAEAFLSYQTILDIFQNYHSVSSRFLGKK